MSWRIAALLFVLGLVTRWPLQTTNLWAHDSVLYARAIEQFDPLDQRPQAPGYLYYVVLIRGLAALTGDANRAMTIVSVIAAAVAIALLYLLAARMYDERTGRASAAFLLTAVTFWGESEVAYPYTLLAALTIGCALLYWRALVSDERRGQRLLVASIASAVAIGFRTDLAIFLAPLWLFVAWRAPRAWTALGAGVGAALVATWFLASAAADGGTDTLLRAFREQGSFIDERYSVFGNGSRALAVNAYDLARFVGRAMYFLIPVAVVPALSADARRIDLRERRRAAFVLLWTLTPLLVYLPIHIGEYGYVFSMLPGICVIAARGAVAFARGTRTPQLFPMLVAAIALANAAIFLVSDTPLSARDIVRRDLGLDEKLSRLERSDLGHATVITGYDSLVVEHYTTVGGRASGTTRYAYDPSGAPQALVATSVIVVWDDLLRVSGEGWEEVTMPHGARLRVARDAAGSRVTMNGLVVDIFR